MRSSVTSITSRMGVVAAGFLVLALLLNASTANAAKRALVIGINEYRHIAPLERAVGDAQAMSDTLAKLGFDVTKSVNADRRRLNLAISDFIAGLEKGDVALVHYSGHGVEIDGENYLLPSDIPKPRSGRPGEVKYEAIGLQRLIAQVADAGARARVFVIDACRDNPFAQSGVRSIGSTRGLARVEAPAGTFVMYSAGYRQLALDRLDEKDTDDTSIYTRVLTKELLVPGRAIAEVARVVRREVQQMAKSVGHVQRPAYYDELTSGLVLLPDENPAQPVKVKPEPVSRDNKFVELTYWETIKDKGEPALFEAYLKKYPDGTFSSLARKFIADLQGKVEVARVDPGSANEVEADTASEEPEPLSKRELVLNIQQNLDRVGCDPGRPDGVWGARSSRALQQFQRHSGQRIAALEPSVDVLDVLKGLDGRVCPLVCGARYDERGGKCVLKTCASGEVLNRSGRCVAKARPEVRKKRVTGQPARKQPARKAAPRGEQCGWCGTSLGTNRFCGHTYLSLKRAGKCR